MAGIKIPVGTDNTGLNTGVAAAQKKLNQFKVGAIGVFTAITAATGFVVAGLTKMARRLDRIEKLSRRGLSTEFIQQLEYLAALSGTNLEMAARAVSQLVKEIKSADGPSSKVAANLEALNLDLETLKQMSPQELFLTVAKSIGGLSDEGDQLAVVTGLLGTRYAELLPLIQELADKDLPKLNAVTQDTIDRTAALNDQVTKIKFAWYNGMVEPVAAAIKVLASILRYIAIAGEQITYLFIQIGEGGRQVAEILDGVLELDVNKIRSGLNGVRREYKLFFADLRRAYDEGQKEIAGYWEIPEKKEKKEGNDITLPKDSEVDVIGDEGRAAIASYNKIAETRRSDRRDAVARKTREGDLLADDASDIKERISSRMKRFEDPASITASSMRSIGGGGGVASPYEQIVRKLNESQLEELKKIYQAIRNSNSSSNGPVLLK